MQVLDQDLITEISGPSDDIFIGVRYGRIALYIIEFGID